MLQLDQELYITSTFNGLIMCVQDSASFQFIRLYSASERHKESLSCIKQTGNAENINVWISLYYRQKGLKVRKQFVFQEFNIYCIERM